MRSTIEITLKFQVIKRHLFVVQKSVNAAPNRTVVDLDQKVQFCNWKPWAKSCTGQL